MRAVLSFWRLFYAAIPIPWQKENAWFLAWVNVLQGVFLNFCFWKWRDSVFAQLYSVCNRGNFCKRVLVGSMKNSTSPRPECMIKRGRFNTWYDICIKVCIIKDSCLNCVFILHILRVESLIGRKEQIIIILFELLM